MGEGNRYPDLGSNRTLNRLNIKRSTARNLTVKLSKVKGKERILKVAREKWLITYKGTPLLPRRLSVGFLRNLAGQERVGWYSQTAGKKNWQSRISYQSFIWAIRERKTFLEKQRWGGLSRLNQTDKKYWKEFLKLKWMDAISNMKVYENIKQCDKDKYIVKLEILYIIW